MWRETEERSEATYVIVVPVRSDNKSYPAQCVVTEAVEVFQRSRFIPSARDAGIDYAPIIPT